MAWRRARTISVAVILFATLSSSLPVAVGQEEANSRVEVTLVLLDAVVTDRKGIPVPGLSIEDFDLLVDNNRVPIAALERGCEAGSADTPTVTLPGTTAGLRHMILLYDLSHLLLSSRRNAIKVAIRFVDERMGPDDRVMVLALMRGLYVISPFTSDRALLRGRLEQFLEDRKLVDPAAFEESVHLARLDELSRFSTTRSAPPAGPVVRGADFDHVEHFDCAGQARTAEIDARRTFRAIGNTLASFSGIPGRKALLFFTESLRANPGGPFGQRCRIPVAHQEMFGLTALPDVGDLLRQANLAGITFYPVHAGGLSAGPTPKAESLAKDLQVDLALTTGGKNYSLMGNSLAAFEQARRDLACHYVLAYRPEHGLRQGKHRVSISVHRKHVKVRHREYFTI